jgi:uncharacterized oligopeptide transporter (OPT) family protein
MFIGALIALWMASRRPRLHATYTIAASSGIIAGESLMGVGIALVTVLFRM